MSNLTSFRAVNFGLLLYPEEDNSHRLALEYIRFNFECAYVTHDKDVDEESGEVLKSHTHVVIRLTNARTNVSLSKELGIAINYIQKIKNFEGALEYLIHLNDENKYQYDLKDVKGSDSLILKLKKYINNKGYTEEERVIELFEYIDSIGYVTIKDFSKFAVSVGKWDIFRRSYSFFKDYIIQHNQEYEEMVVKQRKEY